MSPQRSDPLPRSGHALVNGISMYHEAHGRAEGVPLVLLHGGGSTIEVTFGKVLPVLARSRRVVAAEEQGHGRTTDRDAPVVFKTSADDVAALLDHLQIGEADVFGFSNGASVALQLAIRHPRRVRRMVFASAFAKRRGAAVLGIHEAGGLLEHAAAAEGCSCCPAGTATLSAKPSWRAAGRRIFPS